MVLKQNEMATRPAATNDPLDHIKSLGNIECGKEAKKHFNIAEGYRNLNHGTSACHYATCEIHVPLPLRAMNHRMDNSS